MSKNNSEDAPSDCSPPCPPVSPQASNLLPDHHSPMNELAMSGPAGFTDFCCSSFMSHSQPSYRPYQPPLGLPAGYSPPTPFPSQANMYLSGLNSHKEDWLYPSLASGSLPSCLLSGECSSYTGEACFSHNESLSMGTPSLERPQSLHSVPATTPPVHNFYPLPYFCPCPVDVHRVGSWHHQTPGYPVPHRPYRPENSRYPNTEFSPSEHNPPHPGPKSTPNTAPLSLEQRKVFVTYEADDDKHVKEVINFVALLRHNGFYTHIDMFEQQFRSINKIDFMERYINEKDYLIIIVISPKYYETVTNASSFTQNDETLNTVYIHKQLQSEFIQNGCRNFRFIPILFPGAKKCHVPTWLQNTHVFSWPRDRDDILRRLMRLEKYNPPPIGELPTIVSIPI